MISWRINCYILFSVYLVVVACLLAPTHTYFFMLPGVALSLEIYSLHHPCLFLVLQNAFEGWKVCWRHWGRGLGVSHWSWWQSTERRVLELTHSLVYGWLGTGQRGHLDGSPSPPFHCGTYRADKRSNPDSQTLSVLEPCWRPPGDLGRSTLVVFAVHDFSWNCHTTEGHVDSASWKPETTKILPAMLRREMP